MPALPGSHARGPTFGFREISVCEVRAGVFHGIRGSSACLRTEVPRRRGTRRSPRGSNCTDGGPASPHARRFDGNLPGSFVFPPGKARRLRNCPRGDAAGLHGTPSWRDDPGPRFAWLAGVSCAGDSCVDHGPPGPEKDGPRADGSQWARADHCGDDPGDHCRRSDGACRCCSLHVDGAVCSGSCCWVAVFRATRAWPDKTIAVLFLFHLALRRANAEHCRCLPGELQHAHRLVSSMSPLCTRVPRTCNPTRITGSSGTVGLPLGAEKTLVPGNAVLR